MDELKHIKNALISVYHKDGLDELLALLHREGVRLLSTGGTQQYIESLGYPCAKVEDLTGYPSILGGRVKTLHPKVFGGILARQNFSDDQADMAAYAIAPIDLVIVDLYPFEDTVAQQASESEIVEKIDIGGISLIRAAAKNFRDVVIIPSKAQYNTLKQLLVSRGANTTLADRQALAEEAFAVSSHYDTAICQWFSTLNKSTK
ncbi:MAG: IMP cyclohydrolase [Alloprevotella sp.]|nr:IMP cyclohydrolase [Alloprevotella sp.]